MYTEVISSAGAFGSTTPGDSSSSDARTVSELPSSVETAMSAQHSSSADVAANHAVLHGDTHKCERTREEESAECSAGTGALPSVWLAPPRYACAATRPGPPERALRLAGRQGCGESADKSVQSACAVAGTHRDDERRAAPLPTGPTSWLSRSCIGLANSGSASSFKKRKGKRRMLIAGRT